MNKLKVVVLGSEDVGKTTIMENILDKMGKVEYKGTTTAIDYGNLVSDGKEIHIFGTPGQERFKFMREITLRGADLVVLVLDGSRGMVEEDKRIIEMLEDMEMPYLVFINKIDIAEREQINKLLDEIREYCKSCHCIIEGSGLRGDGLDKLKEVMFNICDGKNGN